MENKKRGRGRPKGKQDPEFIDKTLEKLVKDNPALADLFNTAGLLTIELVLDGQLTEEEAQSRMLFFRKYILHRELGLYTGNALYQQAKKLSIPAEFDGDKIIIGGLLE